MNENPTAGGQVARKKGQADSKLTILEDRYYGEVPFKTYKEYVSVNGGVLFVGAVSLGLLSQLFANIVIIKWCDDPHSVIYLLFFTLLSIGGGLMVGLRSVIMIYSTLKQGRRMFAGMMRALLLSPIQWWDSVPTGRVMNRLTKDITEVDEILPFTTGWYIICVLSLLLSAGVCIFDSSVLVLIPFLLFMAVALSAKNYYLKTQRELTRMIAITKSPVLSAFKEISEGLPFIRALRKDEFFTEGLLKRIVHNSCCMFTTVSTEGLFKVSLLFLSTLLTGSSVAAAVFGSLSGAYVGLLLTYVFQLNKNVTNYVLASTNIENRMIAFERCESFTQLEPQRGLLEFQVTREKKPLFERGEIEFREFSMRYREGLPCAIDRLSLRIRAGEKIGIVGRTGAGKSSLTQVLLRLVEGCGGAIFIDGVDIHAVRTSDLRKEITFVAQEPVLINTSLRENLDPTDSCSEEELIEVMKVCCIDYLLADREGLATEITEGGSNLSVGEKQLICLARAILKNSRIVLIDEATANIDPQTDGVIQNAIKRKFEKSTVLTIAHRINTIMHCDRILVMSQGRAAEFGSPEALIRQGGEFAKLYREHVQM